MTRLIMVFIFLLFSCGDGVIRRITPPSKDRGLLQLKCGSERVIAAYKESPLAACRLNEERSIILSEGVYHLRFYAPGHYAQYRVIRIEAGKVTPIRIELLKAPD